MIGIFDSGIGGLTSVRAIMDVLPGYDMIYFGDTARTPYGTKSNETVIQYALENTSFLTQNGAKIIVMACNTASSVATQAIKERFDLPLFEVVTPAVDRSLEISRKYRIGVIGTRATIRSGIYETQIIAKTSTAKVYSAPCPLLVPLVEEGWINKPETTMIIKKYLYPLKIKQIDTLILGCTHYPLLKAKIQQKIGKKVHIIDSAESVAGTIKTYLNHHPELNQTMSQKGSIQLFVSDVTEQFKKTSQLILKRKIPLKKISSPS